LTANPEELPRHVAIIMDGNGRWAEARGRPRVHGHLAGIESVRATTRECARLHLERLTLYAFSSENWKRPEEETGFLMELLERFLVEEREEIMENGVRLEAIGRTQELPPGVLRELESTRALSAGNRGLTLALALNYGGRAEIVDAARRIAEEARSGLLRPDDVTEETLALRLYAPGAPDPDLLIRTGGDMRVSNFLLWEISYSEIFVTPVLWPDFRKEHLHEAIETFRRRERRFGGVPAKPNAET
jgi:undecaprenyl diphosphate synthase